MRMAWLETISNAFPSFTLQHVYILVIVILTVGLTWGIRPAINHFLQRFGPRWSGVGATLVQLLIVGGGMALIVRVSGINALLLVLAITGAFGLGWVAGGETWLTDLTASRHIRSRRLYQVGDWVTLGDRAHEGGYHGVIAAIDRLHTRLDNPGQVTVLIRNSQVVRHPVLVHRQPAAAHGAVGISGPLSPPADTTAAQDRAGDLILEPLTPVSPLPIHGTLAQPEAPSSHSVVPEQSVPTAVNVRHLPVASLLPRGTTQHDHQQAVGSSTAAELTRTGSVPSNESPAKSTLPVTQLIHSPLAPPLTKRATLGKRTIRHLHKSSH
ncbi:MAG: mechanosensitive ion channel [Caldilineaceae bacterium]|nr:mechanosensitive ion channel [Caldilineaceae bacterium]